MCLSNSLNCHIVLLYVLEKRSLILYNPLYCTSDLLLKSNMEGTNQITGALFVSVEKVCNVLDELTLTEGYVTTIKWQHRVKTERKVSLSGESAWLRQRCPQQAN